MKLHVDLNRHRNTSGGRGQAKHNYRNTSNKGRLKRRNATNRKQLQRQRFKRLRQRHHFKMVQVSEAIANIGEKSGSTLSTISKVLRNQYGDDGDLTPQELRRLIVRGVKAGLITRSGHTNRFVIKSVARYGTQQGAKLREQRRRRRQYEAKNRKRRSRNSKKKRKSSKRKSKGRRQNRSRKIIYWSSGGRLYYYYQ